MACHLRQSRCHSFYALLSFPVPLPVLPAERESGTLYAGRRDKACLCYSLRAGLSPREMGRLFFFASLFVLLPSQKPERTFWPKNEQKISRQQHLLMNQTYYWRL